MGDKTDYTKTKKYRALRKALTENLEARGLEAEQYADKVAEYMELWVMQAQLRDDVKARGAVVEDTKNGGMKENRSVTLMLQTSRQMLAIFSAMGFRQEAIKAEVLAPEDDEL